MSPDPGSYHSLLAVPNRRGPTGPDGVPTALYRPPDHSSYHLSDRDLAV